MKVYIFLAKIEPTSGNLVISPPSQTRAQTMAGNLELYDDLASQGFGKGLYLLWEQAFLTRIPQMDWAGRTEGHGNAGETAGFFFHPFLSPVGSVRIRLLDPA